MISKIFCDMDGVLTDFISAAFALWGTTPEAASLYRPAQWDLHASLGISPEEERAKLDAVGVDFWANLKPYPWARILWDDLATLAPVSVLTTPMAGPSASACVAGKVQWLQAWTGNQLFSAYHFTRDKAELARPDRLLIDDKNENVDAWRQAGGVAILFPQPWNRSATVTDSGTDYQKAAIVFQRASAICQTGV